MNFEIKPAKSKDDKELWLDGDFVASWLSSVDDMEVIVPYAIDHAYKLGQEAKAAEVCRVLGLRHVNKVW